MKLLGYSKYWIYKFIKVTRCDLVLSNRYEMDGQYRRLKFARKIELIVSSGATVVACRQSREAPNTSAERLLLIFKLLLLL